MRVLVTNRQGEQQVIALTEGVWTVIRGKGGKMDRIRNAHGFEYFFFRSDGTYDGWGMECKDCSIEGAQELLDIGPPREDTDA
jgi:hypothetical protein